MIPSPLLKQANSSLETLNISPGMNIDGLPSAVLPLLLSYLHGTIHKPVLVALSNDEDGLIVRDTLHGTINDDPIPFYPSAQSDQDKIPGFHSPLESLRFGALETLLADAVPPFFLMSNATLAEGLPPTEELATNSLKAAPGILTYDVLREWLPENGYESASIVTDPGTFALRGSVIDCYPVNAEAPVRFDFMGDNLEGVREFDIHSQIGTIGLTSTTLMSLVQSESDTVPVYKYFPQGWVLVKQLEEDLWSVTSNEVDTTDTTIDLAIEPFERGVTEEILSARRELFGKSVSRETLLFCGDRRSQLARANELAPSLALEDGGGAFALGFSSVPLGLFVLTPVELFRGSAPVWHPSLRKAASSVSSKSKHIEALEPGDPVVHVNYGIGRYDGLTKLNVSGTRQECLVVVYKGGDKVYISTDKIALVLPYTGSGDTVIIDSLKGTRWERVKRQTRRSAEEVVDQLADLYAQRLLARGISHPEPDDLQQEMEDAFPYNETPDQALAAEEIMRDMHAPQPMDRLLCGDVGFGKTEVAMRAAFQAIRGGYQVALLAPTTILADQHLISFRSRMSPFSVNIGMLSRFVPKAQQLEVLAGLQTGRLDMVIGTHKIISKDIIYKNLGLLIIDEEHRFGVKQKEWLKELKTSIDVLSLTATPLPRTLHFSLSGIRDISRLDTPPRERIPIITEVSYYNNDLVRSSVMKEVERGGQVFFVHNEVKSIEKLKADLTQLLPGVSIGIAHGQMDGKTLEQTMLAFADGEFDVLLCTSIIESGIDLPNVNTVIINNAHRFGLSQIYQIRGRVGRSNRQAYAHLLVPRRPKLSIDATKRLKTIERNTALGSGYAIALKDMEIRGTGNIFGLEQSGHVAAVGLDLYTKIIRDVIRERNLLGGDDPQPLVNQDEITIRLVPLAGIPETYIEDPHLRLNLYRRLSSCSTLEDIASFQEELQDRFGEPPHDVIYLLNSAKLRIRAVPLGIRAVKEGADHEVFVEFAHPDNPAALLSNIHKAMELIGLNYRFHNLKSGDLRLICSGNRDHQIAHVERIFDALDRAK